MEPIATYSERLVQVRRTFELYADRVIVHAAWLFGRRFTMNIPLAGLTPEPQQFVVRYRLFRYAMMVFAAGMLVTALAVYQQKPPPLTPLAAIGIAVATVGALGLAITGPLRRVTFVRFEGDKGAGLDLARAGPDRGSFDDFVQRIRKQIRAVRRG